GTKIHLTVPTDELIEVPVRLADGSEGIRTYRIHLGDVELVSGSHTVAGALESNRESDEFTFAPSEEMPANQEVSLKATASGQVWSGADWAPATLENGSAISQSISEKFSTGSTRAQIPLSNVVASYPAMGQQYFLAEECNTGTIQLSTGQAKLTEQSGNQ